MSTTLEANAVLVVSEATKVAAPSPTNQLTIIIKENQLEAESASFLTTTFVPLLKRAEEWAVKANAIKVKDASDTGTMNVARITRLELRKVRIAAEKAKESLKAEGLRRNNAIQGAYNIVKFLTEPLEEKLLEQEQYVERQEATRKAKLKIERETIMSPFAVTIGMDISFYPLGDMPQDSFDILLQTTKTQAEAKTALAAKAESDRLAKEKADADERARVQAENEKLRQEAVKLAQEKVESDKRASLERAKLAQEAADVKKKADALAAKVKAESDAKIAAEKAKNDAALAAERKKAQDAASAAAETARKAKIESDRIIAEAAEKARKIQEATELQAKKDREAREELEKVAKKAKELEDARVAAEQAAAKKAAGAPDKVKIKAFTASVKTLVIPSLSTIEGKTLGIKIQDQLNKLVIWIDQQTEKI